MIELFTAVNNTENEKGEIHTNYTIRFETDSKYFYQMVRDFCRNVLDRNYINKQNSEDTELYE